MSRPLPTDLVLYTRPGCHLCDDARAVLVAEGIAFEEVDITRDGALEAEYGLAIPVVELHGRCVFEAGMNPADLPGLIRRQAGERAGA